MVKKLLLLTIFVLMLGVSSRDVSANRTYYQSADSSVLQIMKQGVDPDVVLSPGEVKTLGPFPLGNGEVQGFSWRITPAAGAPNLRVEILQCNTKTGTFAEWSNPSATGTFVTNQFALTTNIDGTDVDLVPSAWCQVKLTNDDADTVTVHELYMMNQ